MLARLRLTLALGSVMLAMYMLIGASPASAITFTSLAECTAHPSQNTCCQCAGVGPNPESGSKFCYQSDPGQGGTDWCNDEVCPYEDPPCGIVE